MSDAGGGDGSGLECYDKVPSEHKTASAAKPNFTAIRAGIDVSWDQQLNRWGMLAAGVELASERTRALGPPGMTG
jgi:hypothetical protein